MEEKEKETVGEEVVTAVGTDVGGVGIVQVQFFGRG